MESEQSNHSISGNFSASGQESDTTALNTNALEDALGIDISGGGPASQLVLNAAQNLTPGGLEDDFSAEGVSQSIASELGGGDIANGMISAIVNKYSIE